MLLEYFKAFFLIFVAELGDKSQILAMVFATKYKIRYVLIGIFLGIAFNHGLAVLLGTYLSDIIPLDLLALVAGILFVFFGIWSLKVEEEEEENVKVSKLGPILTVGIAFFIGELGDKTQLATITLSTQTQYPLVLWMGTVSGMVLTGAIGIYIGRIVGEKIPELLLKIVSAIVFIFFGSLKLLDTLPEQFTTMPIMIIYFGMIGTISYVLIKKNIEADRESGYKKAARELYEYTKEIKNSVDNICIGCDHCIKENCLIGYAKEIINCAIEEENKIDKKNNGSFQLKDFDKTKVKDSLILTIQCIRQFNDIYKDKDFVIHDVRQALEMILFEKSIKYNNIDDYLNDISKYDKEIAMELKNTLQ